MPRSRPASGAPRKLPPKVIEHLRRAAAVCASADNRLPEVGRIVAGAVDDCIEDGRRPYRFYYRRLFHILDAAGLAERLPSETSFVAAVRKEAARRADRLLVHLETTLPEEELRSLASLAPGLGEMAADDPASRTMLVEAVLAVPDLVRHRREVGAATSPRGAIRLRLR